MNYTILNKIIMKYSDILKFKLQPNSKNPTGEWAKEKRKQSVKTYPTDFDTTSNNLGFECGKINNVIVVDLDFYDKKGKPFNKEESLYLKAFGDNHLQWDTFTVKTARGGYHLYFQYDSEIGSRHNSKHQIDIQSCNTKDSEKETYVVCPNSVVNGQKYEIINDTDIKSLPQDLKKFIIDIILPLSEQEEEDKNKKKPIRRRQKENKKYEFIYKYNLNNFSNKELKNIINNLDKKCWESYEGFLRYTSATKELYINYESIKSIWDDVNKTKPNYDYDNNMKIWDSCALLPESVQQVFGNDFCNFTKYRPVLENTIKPDETINKQKLGYTFFNESNSNINHVVKSDTGSGKTTAFMHYVKDNDLKFISLVSRVSLGESQYNTFSEHGIDCKFFKYENYCDGDSYITTIDSIMKLHKLKDLSQYVIFLDEFNSIIEYLCTSDTLNKTRSNIYPLLVGVLKGCKQFIATDADISDSCLMFLKENKKIKPFKYTFNTYLHNKDIDAKEIFDFDTFCSELLQLDKYMCCTDSKKVVNKLTLNMNDKSVKVITSDINEDEFNFCLDKYDKIIFSPKIVYGLDSTMKRPVYAYYKEHTISPPAMIQQICRSRNISYVRFLFAKKSFNYNDIQYDELKAHMLEMNIYCSKFFQMTEKKKLGDQYLQIASRFQFNSLCYETNKYAHFLKLLDDRGFVRNNQIKKTNTKIERDMNKQLKEAIEENFNKDDKFVTTINEFFKIDKEEIDNYKEFFIDTHLRREHLNICAYLDNNIEDILGSLFKREDYEVNKLQSDKFKLQFIMKLKKLAGSSDKLDIKITKELNARHRKTMLEEFKNLNIRFQGKDALNFDSIESTQKVLNKVMRSVFGNGFIKSKQVGKKKVSVYKIDDDTIEYHRKIQSFRTVKKTDYTKKLFK